MVTLLTVVHITVCLFLILVVLLQAGKGGGMGIAFGGTGSQTVFGSSGAGNFLTRLTSIIATVFLVTSLALAYYSSRQDSKRLQELSSQKAAEKKAEDEKAVKLKAEMEKIRASAGIGKDAGTAGNAPGNPPEGVAGTPATTPMIPLKLKLPGEPVGNGAAVPVGAKPTGEAPTNQATKTATPNMKKTVAPPGESTAPTTPGESAAPRSDQTAPKPVVRRRKPAAPVAAPTPGESQPSPVPAPEKAPAAPAAPAE